MTVLILNAGDEKETELLTDAVEERGHEAITIDVSNWPSDEPLTMVAGAEGAVFGSEFEYEDVTGAYVNYHRLFRLFEPQFRDELKADFTPTFAQITEYRGMFEGLCRVLEQYGAEVVPGLRNHRWQDQKPGHLHLFGTLDVPVPDTLFTNDPDEVRSFYESHDRVIFKAVTRGGTPHVMSDEDVTEERLANLATAPVQFQEYVEGEDLRVYVLDGEVVGATRYESDTENFSFKLDQKEGREVSVEPASPSDGLVGSVTEATAKSGLTYGAVDVRRRPDGTYALLELNEAPKFAAADIDADQDVAGALAEFLVE